MYKDSSYWLLTAATSAGGGFLKSINWAELPDNVVIIVVLGILLRFLIKSYEDKLSKYEDRLDQILEGQKEIGKKLDDKNR